MKMCSVFGAIVCGFLLSPVAPALADGGGGGGGSELVDDLSARPGLRPRTMQCVRQQSGVLPDKTLADYAYVLAKAERYQEALQVLDLMQDRNTAEALNYRGYATRKLGRVDEGIGYYLKSVSLDPKYAEVREYLGEAYVTKGDLARAKEQLRAIEKICGTECEQYKDLAKAISENTKS